MPQGHGISNALKPEACSFSIIAVTSLVLEKVALHLGVCAPGDHPALKEQQPEALALADDLSITTVTFYIYPLTAFFRCLMVAVLPYPVIYARSDAIPDRHSSLRERGLPVRHCRSMSLLSTKPWRISWVPGFFQSFSTTWSACSKIMYDQSPRAHASWLRWWNVFFGFSTIEVWHHSIFMINYRKSCR